MKIKVKISEEPLSIDDAYQFVLDKQAGGNCLFVGTTRVKNKGENVTHLDFESYIPMAKKEMEKIARDAIEKFNLIKVAIYHRIGKVDPKEIAVIIAVSSKHRKESFQGCEYAIDTLKETVPIWKKEHLTSGTVWVNANP